MLQFDWHWCLACNGLEIQEGIGLNGPPWRLSGEEPTFQCRRHGFNPWPVSFCRQTARCQPALPAEPSQRARQWCGRAQRDGAAHVAPCDFPCVSPENSDRTVCKEIRHNSTGCLWMEEQCEKCQEILGVDCSASNPTQTLLRQQLNESLQLAEKFSRLYNQLLQSYQQKLLNTSALLKQLNEQFTWVSQLANLTQNDDQYHLQVSMVSLECSDPSIPSGLTKVAVKLFNSFPITVTVPQEVSSPDFMENAVEKALQRYRQRSP
uniref:Clusterin C-terminal domain-containing protein n=1 Tax=Bos indicus x Bos taurus TaxID=30522 RepID=A0A4W2DBX3_BOBOX